MNHTKLLAIFLAAALLLAACGTPTAPESTEAPVYTDATQILLDDGGVTVDGTDAGTDPTAAVYTANDIIYYESGKDFTYGEGSDADAHTPEEAAAHTVVHIAQPGTYEIRGNLSLGQIAVDLGSDAETDPAAVVTLVLSGADITCQVAPAVIFYSVYECGSGDAQTASKDVDTAAAGANVIITDGTVNTISGAYVAKIYKSDSVVLNEAGTAVEDASKLHKYDGAFYSKQSMNIFGGPENTGVLQINAKNEGLDSEMHLTINGGNIRIASGNDGINTNEDGISVTTINGGSLNIRVTGETGEGDGIDSNGWLVINGGCVTACACSDSADAGIDSDMGIHINGGTVMAAGHMLDRIEDGGQTYAVFSFAGKQTGSETIALTDPAGSTLLETAPGNAYSVLIYSSPDLQPGTYTLSSDGNALSGSAAGWMGRPGGQPGGMGPGQPDGMTPPAEDRQPPEEIEPGQGERPHMDFKPGEGSIPPEGFEPPEDGSFPTMPEGSMGGAEVSAAFVIADGGNMFSGIQATAQT